MLGINNCPFASEGYLTLILGQRFKRIASLIKCKGTRYHCLAGNDSSAGCYNYTRNDKPFWHQIIKGIKLKLFFYFVWLSVSHSGVQEVGTLPDIVQQQTRFYIDP